MRNKIKGKKKALFNKNKKIEKPHPSENEKNLLE